MSGNSDPQFWNAVRSHMIRYGGRFEVGAPVDIALEKGHPFARGLVGYGAEELQRIAGLRTNQIEQIEEALGRRDLDEVVHRDEMVIL